MPKSRISTPSERGCSPSRRTTSTPKASSPRNTFPTPATSVRPVTTVARSRCRLARLDLVDGEVQGTPARDAPVLVGIIVQRHGQVRVVLYVEQDGLDFGDPPDQEHVLGVAAALAGLEPDLAAPADLVTPDVHRV